MEDEADVLPDPSQAVLIDADHVLIEHIGCAFAEGQQAYDGPANGRLARARLAYEADDLGWLNIERDAIDGSKRRSAPSLGIFNCDIS